MKKKILAGILSLLVVLQLGIFAFAENEPVNGSVVITGNDVTSPADTTNTGITENGASVSIEDSTINTTQGGSGGQAIKANNSTVEVDSSNISTSGTYTDGILAYNQSKITVDHTDITSSGEGSYGISAKQSTATVQNSEITAPTGIQAIESNVTVENTKINARSAIGISALYNSIVTVDHTDITASGDHSQGIYAFNHNTVTVKNSKITSSGEAACGISTDSTSNVTIIDGSVTGTTGANVTVGDTNVIILDTTVTSTGTKEDGDAALKVSLAAGTTADQTTIIVDKLEVTDDAALVSATDSNGNDVTGDVATQISYIMHSIENATVTGTTKLLTYDVANEGNQLVVKVADGFELQSDGQYATVADNHDGTYTITVNRGGDLYFTARVKYVPAAYTTTTVSVTTNAMKGNKNDATQPVMVVNMKASHFQKVMVDGTDLAEGSFVVGEKDNGLLTFQFSTGYIKSLAAGTYSLQFVTTENVTHTMKLVVAEDGTYTVSY